MAGNAEQNTEIGIPAEEHGVGFPPFDATTYSSQLLWLAVTFGFFYWIMKNVADASDCRHPGRPQGPHCW
jgi:F-type H+-transporting ATPase subunit b